MKSYTINHLSLEYLPVRVSVVKNGDSYDPTGDDVEIAVPLLDVDPVEEDLGADPPISSDWFLGTWDTVDDEYFARILIGPAGDIELDRGKYDIYVRITDSPEIPVIRAGILLIT